MKYNEINYQSFGFASCSWGKPEGVQDFELSSAYLALKRQGAVSHDDLSRGIVQGREEGQGKKFNT